MVVVVMLVVVVRIAMLLAWLLAMLLTPIFVAFFGARLMARFNCNPSVATRCDNANGDQEHDALNASAAAVLRWLDNVNAVHDLRPYNVRTMDRSVDLM